MSQGWGIVSEIYEFFGRAQRNSSLPVSKSRIRKRLNLNFNSFGGAVGGSGVNEETEPADVVAFSSKALRQVSQSGSSISSTPINARSLYNSLALSMSRNAPNGAAARSPIPTFMSQIQDLSSMFGGLVSENTMGTFLGNLDELADFNPEMAEKLFILVETLAILNSKDPDALLRSVSNAIRGIMNVQNNLAAVEPNTAEGATAPPSAGNGANFVIDIKITVSEQTEVILSKLSDSGFVVIAGSLERTEEINIRIAMSNEAQQSDPIVLDMKGDGVNLTRAGDGGKLFDINGDGKLDSTAFVQGDDGLLALDKNGNGVIDDGTELFGDQNGAANGFEELAKYDSNQDGVIDAKDEVFESLKVLHDKNADGAVDNGEVSSLGEMGVKEINLGYSEVKNDDGKGNAITQVGTGQDANGARVNIYDVLLGFYG